MAQDYLLLEDGDKITLEDSSGFIHLEDAGVPPPVGGPRPSRPFPPIFLAPRPAVDGLKLHLKVRKGFTTFSGLFPANASPILRYTFKHTGSTLIPKPVKIIANPIILKGARLKASMKFTKKFFMEGSIVYGSPIKLLKAQKSKRLRKLLNFLNLLEDLDK